VSSRELVKVFSGRAGRRRAANPEWFSAVQPFDVLRTPSGDLRVVRTVTRFKCGALRSVCCAIRRCSWTKRPYTVLGLDVLRRCALVPGVNVAHLAGTLDVELLAAIGADAQRTSLKCCDVVGVMP
jgi:hypothetical protein